MEVLVKIFRTHYTPTGSRIEKIEQKKIAREHVFAFLAFLRNEEVINQRAVDFQAVYEGEDVVKVYIKKIF